MSGRLVRLIAAVLSAAVLASLIPTLLGFNLLDRRWPPGEIFMEMQLGAGGALFDGSPDWDECAIAGLAQWNEHLGGTGVSFNANRNATRAPALAVRCTARIAGLGNNK